MAVHDFDHEFKERFEISYHWPRRPFSANAGKFPVFRNHHANAATLATFLGPLAEGLTASIAGRWSKEARVGLTVPAAVMIVPGLYALETLVYFDRGEILQVLSPGVLVGFIVSSIAFDLAAERFISQPQWLRE